MKRVLRGYVLRSLLASWGGIAAVLLAVLVLSQIPAALGRAVTREIAPQLVWQVVGWMSIANVAAILPISTLLAVVLTLGRLASDAELTAMRASGVSLADLLVPIALLVLPIVALQAWFAWQLAPDAMCSAAKERSQAARNLALSPIRGGEFQAFGDGATYFVESVDADGTLRNVFIKRGTVRRVEVVLARQGRLEYLADRDLLRLHLGEGRRYEGTPGTANFRQLSFAEYVAAIPLPHKVTTCPRSDARATLDLARSGSAADRAELNWRLGLPLMPLLLAVLALPLSITRPREGRYARVPAAIGIFFVYIFGAIGLTGFSARNPAVGPAAYWSLHGIVALAALLAFWLRQNGRLRPRWKRA